MRQAVQAVAYMHALVPIVLHNDLKPGNVMMKKGCLCHVGVNVISSFFSSQKITSSILHPLMYS
jgi:serine/threonine protein kinase